MWKVAVVDWEQQETGRKNKVLRERAEYVCFVNGCWNVSKEIVLPGEACALGLLAFPEKIAC